MNGPASAEPGQDVVKDSDGTDSHAQPTGAGDTTARHEADDHRGGDVPDERPEPLPGYEHL